MEKVQEQTQEKRIYQEITTELESDGIATVWFDTPGKKVNLLSYHLLDELESTLDDLTRLSELKAVIFTSKKTDNFIAGADLSVALEGGFTPEKGTELGNRGRNLFQKVAEFKVPTVAAINGLCLGGGTELALACDYRVASNTEKTKIGLPEVQLGILPAWGGTQRLPRLIALPDALDLMLTGKRIDARKAKKMGLVDLSPPPEILLRVAKNLARDAAAGKSVIEEKRAKHQGLLDKVIKKVPAGQNIIFKQARKNVLAQSKGFYPAPLRIIDAVQEGLNKPLKEAFAIESAAFKELLAKPETRNLMNLFFINQELGKVPGAEEKGLKPQKVEYLGILGAGVMGAGIAQVANFKGTTVRIKDVNNQALANGLQTIHGVYHKLLKRRKMTPKQVEDKMRQISATTDYSGFKKADMVIEAIVERMDVKKAVFSELENHIAPHTILASNTSSLSINEMAQVTARPDRFVGIHFFNPVHKMPLVEVIPGHLTSEQTLLTAIDFVKKLGKTPIIVKDSPGFLVNRIIVAYGNEACLLLEEGSDITTIDRIMTDYGMPMGFFTMADLAGIDIGYHAAQTMRSLFESRPGYRESQILVKLYEDQRYGKKTGKGFYLYKDQTPIPDYRYLEDVVHSLHPENRPREIGAEEIRDRLVMIMMNEAALCLQEKLVQSAGEIDMAMLMGTGYPPFRGGLFRQVDMLGARYVVDQLKRLSEKHSPRFSPCQLLVDAAESDRKFYPHI